MNSLEAVKAMERGESVRRTDWGYPKCTYISLLSHMGHMHFYMTGKYDTSPNLLEGYSLSYCDIKSENWEEVEKVLE